MQTRTILLNVGLSLGLAFANSALAGEAAERWNTSEARQQFLAVQAQKLGIDISTEEGRAELKAELTERRISFAAELGFDITTEEGRAAFKAYRQEKRISHATELGYDITTEEGREAFHEFRQQNREGVREQISLLSDEERAALKEELAGLTREERREILKAKFES